MVAAKEISEDVEDVNLIQRDGILLARTDRQYKVHLKRFASFCGIAYEDRFFLTKTCYTDLNISDFSV